jgi:hypothetical protein
MLRPVRASAVTSRTFVLAKPLDPIGRRLSPLNQLGIQRAAGIALIDPAEHLAKRLHAFRLRHDGTPSE